MTQGLREWVRALRERGQSEVLGATLLTGIMVILVALAGLFLFADFEGDDEQLLANIEGDVTADQIELSHDGGDTFSSDEIEVVLTGDDERDLRLNNSFNATEGSEGNLAPGDTWQYNTSDDLIVGDGRLLVIHEPSNTVLLSEGYRIQVVPGGIELRVTDWDGNSQSDQADVYGTGDNSSDPGQRWDYDVFVDFGDDEPPVKNPDDINITLDPETDNLDYSTTDDDLIAYDPGSRENVTVTASVDGFQPEDDVNVSVYPVATLNINIDGVNPVGPSTTSTSTVQPSDGLSALSSDGATALQDGPVKVPANSTVEVTFTAENNKQVPAPNKTITLSSSDFSDTDSVSLGTVDPGKSVTETLKLELPENFNGTANLSVETEDDTVNETATVTLEVSDSQFEATDLVPNAEQQQTFTLDNVQPGETVTIEPTNAEGAYDSASAVTDDGSASLNGNNNIEYTAPSSPGESVEIRVKGVKAGDVNSGPYEYEVTGLGSDTDTATSSLSRGSGDSGFVDVNATGFDSNSNPTLSFELNSDDIPIDGPEKVAIDLGDAVDSLEMGDAQVKSVSNNVENVYDTLSDGSYVAVELKSSYSDGDTVEVTLEKIDPVFEGVSTVGFSRGANDTASDTIEIEPETQKPSPFESVEVTDIVPNGEGQQQLISFTANSSLDENQLPNAGEKIDIVINAYEPVSGGEGQVAYGGSVATFDSQGQIVNQNTNDNGQLTLEYEPKNDLSPGETIEMRATDINVARLDEQADPYEVRVGPSDSLVAKNTTFNVTRSGTADDAGLSTFTVEDLAGTNKQTLNITFEPDGAFRTGKNENGAVTIDLTDALIDSDVYWDGNSISIVEGKGSLNSDNTSKATYITYTAPSDGYDEQVTIQLTVNPDQSVLGEAYKVGVSRGTAGTAGNTFGVFQPAQFDVTIQNDSNALLGTQYGSENDGLSVTATVENKATYTDTQPITLDTGAGQTKQNVTVAGESSKTVTLSIGSPTKGNYTANVSSQTDYDTADARVFENPPEFIAALETVTGTGDTVGVEFHATNLAFSGSDVNAYQLALSFDDSVVDFDSVEAGNWSDPFASNDLGDAVSVNDFNANPKNGEPALTFNFTLVDSGTSAIEFDNDISGVPGDNRFNDEDGQKYDVLFLDGAVTVS